MKLCGNVLLHFKNCINSSPITSLCENVHISSYTSTLLGHGQSLNMGVGRVVCAFGEVDTGIHF